MTVLGEVFSFRGRSRRSEWWLIGIGLSVLQAVGTVLTLAVVVGPEVLTADPGLSPPMDVVLIQTAWWLLFLWPTTAVSVRRAHDRGGTGWVVLLFQAINLLLGTGGLWLSRTEVAEFPPAFALASMALIILGLFLVITLGFLDGQRGTNRYGPSPKYHDDIRSRPAPEG